VGRGAWNYLPVMADDRVCYPLNQTRAGCLSYPFGYGAVSPTQRANSAEQVTTS